MPIEPHELFEGLDIAGAIETLNLPEATRDFLRDDVEVNAATEAALQQAPESLFPDDPLWTYWDYIPMNTRPPSTRRRKPSTRRVPSGRVASDSRHRPVTEERR